MTTYEFTKDGQVTWIGDSGHSGSEIYWSEVAEQWVVVDVTSRTAQAFDRLLAVRCDLDGDESGLDNVCCACDLDGDGLWFVGVDSDWGDGDGQNFDGIGAGIVWDSAQD